MSLLPADTYLTFLRGMDLPTLSGILTEVDRPPLTSGVSDGWVWVTHAAHGTGWKLARDLTGYRYKDRVADPESVESVFLASTPPCTCPHGQNYAVAHCAEHPFQFAHSRGGFEQTYFNVGGRR
ncbi:hypothetical protein [Streptomyces sp. NPDC018693]|uniref:hypothetical protein n=1 Tax=unclassified Streptomyces TaxID=2593676 RepID=UPI0037BDC074